MILHENNIDSETSNNSLNMRNYDSRGKNLHLDINFLLSLKQQDLFSKFLVFSLQACL